MISNDDNLLKAVI